MTRNSPSFNCPNYLFYAGLAAAGQSAVTLEPVLTPVVRTYNRNATGFYNNVSKIAVDAGNAQIDTNGKWYSYLHPLGYSQFWQVDSSNQIVHLQTVPTGGIFARLLSDNSYIVVQFSFIDTYTYGSNGWNRVDRSFYKNNTLNHMLPFFGLSETGQSFVIMDQSFMSVQLYTRKGLTWSYVENVPLNLTLGIAQFILPIGTGQDTLISSYYNYGQSPDVPSGAVVVHTKRNGQWQQTVTTAMDLGLKAPAALGSGVLVVDQNNVLVAAPRDNFNANASTGGRVLLLRRQFDNSWKFIADYVTNDQVVLGNGLARTSQDIIIGGGQVSPVGGVCWMYTAPLPN